MKTILLLAYSILLSGGGLFCQVPQMLGTGTYQPFSAPANQVIYGTGTGVAYDANFTRNVTNKTTNIITNANIYKETLKVDTNAIGMKHESRSTHSDCEFFIGDASDMGLDSFSTILGYFNGLNNANSYFISQRFLSGLLVNDGQGNFGNIQTTPYVSSVEHVSNNHVNSLHISQAGMQWEYFDTIRYIFPVTNGLQGQVLTTEGQEQLAWQYPGIANIGSLQRLEVTTNNYHVLLNTGVNLLIYNGSSGFSQIYMDLPSAPVDNEAITISFGGDWSASAGAVITYNNGSAPNAATVLSQGLVQRLFYSAADNAWYNW